MIKTATFNDENGDGFAQAGETIDYVFTVTNTGDVTLTDISIDDPLVGVSGSLSSLSPGAVDDTSFTASYTVTQADVDNGNVSNQATAIGNYTDGNGNPQTTEDLSSSSSTTEDDTTVTPFNQNPGIALIKTATFNDENGDGFAQVGETIDYAFSVTNTGDVTLTDISIDDPLVGVSGNLPSLSPGAVDDTSFTATYTVTQADVDNGNVSNQAMATGNYIDGNGNPQTTTDLSDNNSTTGDGTTETPLSQNPGIALIKTATFNDENGDGFAQAGETIDYVFTLTNTGDVTLTDISIDDPLVGVSGSLPSLAPGAVDNTSFTATYTVTQADVDNGNVSNQAVATGNYTDGNGDPQTTTDLSDNNSNTEDDSTVTVFTPEGFTGVNACADEIGIGILLPITNDVLVLENAYSDSCGAVTASFSGQVLTGDSCSWSLARTFTMSGGCYTSDFTVTMVHSGGDQTAPEFVESLPNNMIVQCDALPAVATLTAIDNCGSATVVFQESTIAGDCANEYTLIREWTATDACGNAVTHSQAIEVIDTQAPTFDQGLPGDLVLECGQGVPNAPRITASDNCGAATLSYTETVEDQLCANTFTIVRNWVATDACGNAREHTQYIFIEDTTAPVFISDLPGDTFATCDAIPAAAELLARDNCSDVEVSFSETEQDGDCGHRYKLIREWVATDGCGNSETYVQEVTVACKITKGDIHNAVNTDNSLYDNYFKIDGIECYPNNRVKVFNRWGKEVFSAEGYDNKDHVFRGYSTSNGTLSGSSGLPTGNYFYIIEYQFNIDGQEGGDVLQKSGYLYINNGND